MRNGLQVKKMHRWTAGGLLCLGLLGACSQQRPAVQMRTLPATASGAEDAIALPEPRYVLGPGDLLRVTFLGEPAMDTNAKVTPDGRLLLPLIDQPLLASGLTLDQLKVAVEDQLARYLVDPKTFIHLVEMGSQHVFVLGEVRNPMLATAEPLTLAGVLSACGGLTRDGQKKQILVIRRNPGADAQVFEVDFAKLLEGKSILPDLPLQRYDIVVVPKSRVANVRDFMMAAFGNNIVALRFGLDGVLLQNALQEELDLYYQN
jgi:polysaccharide export outer membrane protein